VWSNLGICCLKLKHGAKALEWLGKALAKDPKHGKALCNAGRAYVLLNDLDHAKECFDEAAAAMPEDATVKKELAKLPALYAKQAAKEKATWQAAFKKM
jgi:Flp pilus assembly protein TadD